MRHSNIEPMEPRHLEAFAAVMSTGSFTSAARLLARSQPAITRMVQELEAGIGYALFVRKGPRVSPTEQGFLLYEDAERALAGLRQLDRRAAEISRGEPQPLLVAATSALALGLLPAALRRLEVSTGPAPVQLRTASPEQVMHAVLSGTVQLGVCSLPVDQLGLQVHWAGELDCVVALPARDPLARLDRVPLAALVKRRLITMSNPYRLRNRVDEHLAKADGAEASSAARIETNSSMNALALVRAGLGVAVLEPLSAQGAPLQGVVLRPVDAAIPFSFGVITQQGRQPSTVVGVLVQALLEVASDLPGFVRHTAPAKTRAARPAAPPPKKKRTR